jgi:short-subunit dehydrogenase
MHNRIDILLANAGVGEVEDFFLDELDEQGLLKEPKYTVLDVNLKGVLACIKLAVYYFNKNPSSAGGKIVMTGSTAGKISIPVLFSSHYLNV